MEAANNARLPADVYKMPVNLAGQGQTASGRRYKHDKWKALEIQWLLVQTTAPLHRVLIWALQNLLWALPELLWALLAGNVQIATFGKVVIVNNFE